MESELIPPKKIKLDHSYKIDPNDISRLCYEQYNKLGKDDIEIYDLLICFL